MRNEPEAGRSEMGTGALIGGMVLFVVLGGPLVYYLWSVVNEILTARFDAVRTLIALPVLLVFLALVTFVSRAVRRWDDPAHPRGPETPGEEAR